MLSECLTNIIGLSLNECECLDEQGGEMDVTGLSGLYMDDMQDGIPLKLVQRNKDCGDGGLWDILEKARAAAIEDFITDMISTVAMNNTVKHRNWKAMIGETRKSNSILSGAGFNKNYYGVKLMPLPIRGGYLTVKGLGLKINTTGVFILKLFSNVQSAAIATQNVNAVAGQQVIAPLPTAIRLPLTDSNGMQIEYYVEYFRDNSYPYSVLFNCNCTGQKHAWEHMITAEGYKTNDENAENKTGNTGHTNGIYIDAAFTCESSAFLCNYDDSHWTTDGYARVVAKTLQFYSILKLGGFIVNSQKIDVYTGLQKEHIWGKMSHARKEIKWRMEFLAQNIPEGVQSCVSCDQNSIKMVTPFANRGKKSHRVVTVYN